MVSRLVVDLRWFEHAVTFHPTRFDRGATWVLHERGEDVWFTTVDDFWLHGWFIYAKDWKPVGSVIFFLGNAGTVDKAGWIGRELSDQGFDVLLFDYRGYGRSDGTVSDERDIYADADAAYDYVMKSQSAISERIVLYGQSLGTAAAVDLAARRECGALVLESGMSSASEMASDVLPWLPRWLHFVARNRFESARKLASIHCPVLVTHGEPDDTIPTAQGRALFAAANEPKQLLIVPGAGHNVVGNGGREYLADIARFAASGIHSHGR